MRHTLLAFVAAVLAFALGYILFVGALMVRTAGFGAPLWILAFVGLSWGAAFSVAILLPLWLLFRAKIAENWLQFALPAVALYAAISAAFLTIPDLSASEIIGNTLMVLPAAVMSVMAFLLVIRGKPHA